jgi:hypothetical protein
MESMPAPESAVTVGVDTHLDPHVAAVIDQAGRLCGTQAFPASTRGYVALVTWAEGVGAVERIGIEGTGTYLCSAADRGSWYTSGLKLQVRGCATVATRSECLVRESGWEWSLNSV